MVASAADHISMTENNILFFFFDLYTLNNILYFIVSIHKTGQPSAVGNLSGCRYMCDCRYRGQDFDNRSVPYFRGDRL